MSTCTHTTTRTAAAPVRRAATRQVSAHSAVPQLHRYHRMHLVLRKRILEGLYSRGSYLALQAH